MISSLTGMEVSNASLYDGGSAVAEASLMAIRAHRKSKSQRILVPAAVNPDYRDVLQAVAGGQHLARGGKAAHRELFACQRLLQHEAYRVVVIDDPDLKHRCWVHWHRRAAGS